MNKKKELEMCVCFWPITLTASITMEVIMIMPMLQHKKFQTKTLLFSRLTTSKTIDKITKRRNHKPSTMIL